MLRLIKKIKVRRGGLGVAAVQTGLEYQRALYASAVGSGDPGRTWRELHPHATMPPPGEPTSTHARPPPIAAVHTTYIGYPPNPPEPFLLLTDRSILPPSYFGRLSAWIFYYTYPYELY